MTVDFYRLKRYYFDMKNTVASTEQLTKGDTAMNIRTANAMMNTGRRDVSAISYYSFRAVCFADRYFAALKLSDRCERPECVF